MKMIRLIPLLFLYLSCSSQKYLEKYVIDYDGIIVERTDRVLDYDQNFNLNNTIYKIGKSYTFSYYYQNKSGEKFLIKKGK
ncbi:hypothetical protein PG326_00025 [Riemerella anatipestifer]|nr:hypothetical protein [Riemerella anatipestifer]MDY3356723.1 hypothetical protein [Riemerella anatipestifer]